MRRVVLMLLMLVASPGLAASSPEERVSVTVKQEADGTHTLVHETIVPASAAEIWRTISTAEGWRGWAAPTARVPENDENVLETSFSLNAPPGHPSLIRQLFTAKIPERLLAFRTTKVPERFPHGETFQRVTHMFELEPVADGTRVRLTSAGYEDSEAGRTLLGFFERGNQISLDRLRSRFVDGPVDWAELERSESSGETE